MIKFFRKNRNWLGIILTLFIILFTSSGIVLNHRKLFSSFNVNRNILPKEYRYTNWNNGAVKVFILTVAPKFFFSNVWMP